ncbi:MAG: hypothetical protein JWN99_1374 [Ilumatobacteraceae bacterium]|nr:hypothetical protein [Ilumatobacteraceae bacterium]
MAYRIDPRESAAAELRRIAGDELASAIQKLRNPGTDGLEQTVHDVRKHCKRVRALVRLARPSLGAEYARANGSVREAAAGLGTLRDAHAVLATFDVLVSARSDQVPANGLRDVRAALAARARDVGDAAGVGQLETAAEVLTEVAGRVDDWPLSDDLRVAVDGAAAYHGMARAAFRASLDDPSDERLHEWRKRVKDGWYHTQLLTTLAPSVLVPARRVLEQLSDALGHNNDLAVLGRALRESPDELGGAQAHEALTLIQHVHDELIDRSWPLGARVYAEGRKAYGRRLRQYASAFDSFGKERRVGDIDALFGNGANGGNGGQSGGGDDGGDD